MQNISETYKPSEEDEQIINFFKNTTNGTFVEIGANHPINLSQTYCLEKIGWNGFLIEPLPDMASLCRKMRKAKVCELACGSPAQSGSVVELFAAGEFTSTQKHLVFTDVEYTNTYKVKLKTFDEILSEENCSNVDFISIDTEGTELDVLKGINLKKIIPKLILIEYHVLSLKVHFHLRKEGYKLINRTGVNNWYIPRRTPYNIPFAKRIKFFRKMYLGTPLRKLQWFIKKYTKHRKFR